MVHKSYLDYIQSTPVQQILKTEMSAKLLNLLGISFTLLTITTGAPVVLQSPCNVRGSKCPQDANIERQRKPKHPDEIFKFLKSMEHLITGLEYDNFDFHEKLVQCLNRTDPLLYRSVNLQWEHFRAFSVTGGDRPQDPWVDCDEDGFPTHVSNWMFQRFTVQFKLPVSL